ncbi:MAG: transcriptional repressor LexA [Firmicutes bacterium]|nr:transcriptional repressor LexA [Bacillota bacterium]
MRTINREKFEEIEGAINEWFFDTGQAPSARELAEAVEMSASNVVRYLELMGKEGIIEYDGGKSRGAVTTAIKKAKCGSKCIPIVGSIACGTPVLAEENIDSYITISTELLGRGNYYFLRASGESMIEAGIDDGDLVLVKQQEEADDGQIIVALTEDGENTLKRYYRDDKRQMICLHPENSTMEDIYVKECRIQGVALKVIKDLR